MALIPYAGYDPDEGRSETVGLSMAAGRLLMARAARKLIDVDRAHQLKAQHFNHREIGIMLAREQGRSSAYIANSVQRALAK